MKFSQTYMKCFSGDSLPFIKERVNEKQKKICFLTLTFWIYQIWIKILLGKLKRLYRYVYTIKLLQLIIMSANFNKCHRVTLYTLMQLLYLLIHTTNTENEGRAVSN